MNQTRFAFRAVQADGSIAEGEIAAMDKAAALAALRAKGARPIRLVPQTAPAARHRMRTRRGRQAAARLAGELAVLLGAGLPLDRALALAIANVDEAAAAQQFAEILGQVREGTPLSQAMRASPLLFPPVAAAMVEAGEANGDPGTALDRLARMLESAEDLRRLIGTAMIYPAALTIVASGVILLMLLYVVPQFETLFASAPGQLPAASRAALAASHALREWGWLMLAMTVAAGLAMRGALRRPEARRRLDALVLRLPQAGDLVRMAETARFAATLGALTEGNVPLPHALVLARRTVVNTRIGDAIEQVAEGVRKGGTLAAPLAQSGVLPPIASGFLRTGEETSRLGPMLARLAEVLERDLRIRIQRLVGILAPAITVLLGATVAAIIAAIMSAIIGFNDLATMQ